MNIPIIKQCSTCRYLNVCVVGELPPGEIENFSNGLLRYRVEGSERAIFHEGEPLEGFYLLCSGVVKLVSSDGAGKEILFDVISPFAVLGSTPNYRQARHIYSAITASETVDVAYVPYRKMKEYLNRYPVLAQGLMACHRQRLHKMFAMRSCMNRPVSDRLLCVLGCIFPAFEDVREAKAVSIPLSQRDLAALIGTTPETISRTLQTLAAEGVIKITKKGRFTINVDVLKDAAARQITWMKN